MCESEIDKGIVDDGSVNYYYNTESFRCDEFKKDHDGLHILFAGCSETEGIGGNVEDAWPTMLLNKMKSKNSGFFNIGTGIPIRIIDLANEMISISRKSLIPNFDEAKPNDICYSLASVTLAESIFGWKSKTKLIDWLKKNL